MLAEGRKPSGSVCPLEPSDSDCTGDPFGSVCTGNPFGPRLYRTARAVPLELRCLLGTNETSQKRRRMAEKWPQTGGRSATIVTIDTIVRSIDFIKLADRCSFYNVFSEMNGFTTNNQIFRSRQGRTTAKLGSSS